MSEDITISQLRAAKKSLEASLAASIYRAVEEFREATGVTPDSINVHMLPVRTLVGDYMVVTDVSTEVRF